MLRLKHELYRMHMSQAECARLAKVNATSFSRIVNGLEPAYPHRGKRIADALGWQDDPAALFEEVPEDDLAHA